ncbi:probable nucleolar protein 5-1 [Tanacetum coccineum]
MALHRQMGLSFQAATITGKKSGQILVLSGSGVEVAATTKTKAKALAEREKQDLLAVRESYADIKVVERETKDLAFRFNMYEPLLENEVNEDIGFLRLGKVDTTIIQAIRILDDFDKELHTYEMRVHEWYIWYFPELGNIVQDNIHYAKLSSSWVIAQMLQNLTFLSYDTESYN